MGVREGLNWTSWCSRESQCALSCLCYWIHCALWNTVQKNTHITLPHHIQLSLYFFLWKLYISWHFIKGHFLVNDHHGIILWKPEAWISIFCYHITFNIMFFEKIMHWSEFIEELDVGVHRQLLQHPVHYLKLQLSSDMLGLFRKQVDIFNPKSFFFFKYVKHTSKFPADMRLKFISIIILQSLMLIMFTAHTSSKKHVRSTENESVILCRVPLSPSPFF